MGEEERIQREQLNRWRGSDAARGTVVGRGSSSSAREAIAVDLLQRGQRRGARSLASPAAATPAAPAPARIPAAERRRGDDATPGPLRRWRLCRGGRRDERRGCWDRARLREGGGARDLLDGRARLLLERYAQQAAAEIRRPPGAERAAAPRIALRKPRRARMAAPWTVRQRPGDAVALLVYRNGARGAVTFDPIAQHNRVVRLRVITSANEAYSFRLSGEPSSGCDGDGSSSRRRSVSSHRDYSRRAGTRGRHRSRRRYRRCRLRGGRGTEKRLLRRAAAVAHATLRRGCRCEGARAPLRRFEARSGAKTR